MDPTDAEFEEALANDPLVRAWLDAKQAVERQGEAVQRLEETVNALRDHVFARASQRPLRRGNSTITPDGVGLVLSVRSCGTTAGVHIEGMADLERGSTTPSGKGTHVGAGVCWFRSRDLK